jgi:GTP-binding protein
MSFLQQTRFTVTVNHLKDLPNTEVHEVAFAGRSNAGKSTAINILCEQKRLAFSSKTPGRTQHINFFSVQARDQCLGYLVDLPGYGYARVDESMRRHWESLLSNYIQQRTQLSGLVIIMDARRPFTDLDHQMVEWYLPLAKPLHILLTKADKLSQGEARLALSNTQKILAKYQKLLPEDVLLSVQLFSALKRIGIDEATAKIQSWLIAP